MQRTLFALATVLAFILVTTVTVNAETIDESVRRQAKNAEVDRENIPVYAISVQALSSGRELPEMPASVMEQVPKALEGWNSTARVGKSEVNIRVVGDFVTFTIDPFSMSVPDTRGRTSSNRMDDPLKTLIGWVRGAHTKGIVFAKTGDSMSMGVPDSSSCMSFTFRGEDNSNLSVACKRFGLGEGEIKFFRDAKDDVLEAEFLTWLASQYGNQGVLYRETLMPELKAQMETIESLINDSADQTGYLTHSGRGYRMESGRQLTASVSSYRAWDVQPGGKVEMHVNVYSASIVKMRIELRYPDGTGLDQSALGNSALAFVSADDLTDIQEYPYRYDILEMDLPSTLKPGPVHVWASATDADGELVLDDKMIGEFEYVASAE